MTFDDWMNFLLCLAAVGIPSLLAYFGPPQRTGSDAEAWQALHEKKNSLLTMNEMRAAGTTVEGFTPWEWVALGHADTDALIERIDSELEPAAPPIENGEEISFYNGSGQLIFSRRC